MLSAISRVCLLALAASTLTAARTAYGSINNDLLVARQSTSGNYDGRYRPQVHFSPPKHFMNDPNGCFRGDDGIWHLYYQYNPTATVAGDQHWGHATSKDLYHWTNQPIALYPPNNYTFVFSGSAVIDRNNTSGFFPNQTNGVVAIYTLAEYPNGQAGPQQQAIAYSRDGGYTFTPYKENPVIPSTSSQFRDPKVIWYRDHWVMVIAYSQDFKIGFYTSKNLKDWTHASNFTSHGLLGLQYECPNLVEMPYVDETGKKHDMFLLQISINPGAPLGGSISEYFPGTFNGTHFEAVDAAARIADFGKDNYAGQFFYGLSTNEYPVSIAWASNWQYTQIVPTGEEGWRSVLSLPRQNYLVKTFRLGWKMVSRPYDMRPILGRTLLSKKGLGNSSAIVDFAHVDSGAVYFEVNVTGLPKMTSSISGSATVNFTFISPETSESIRGGYYLGGDTPFFIDRGNTKGFDNVFFTDKFSTNSFITGNTWSFSGVLDRSILEVFVQDGLESATNTFFSTQPLTVLVFGASDLPPGAKFNVRVKELKSTWTHRSYSNDTSRTDALTIG